MEPDRLLRRLNSGSIANVDFRDMRRLMEALGFELRRVSGSHHIFIHRDLPELVNLQEVRGQVRPYQIRQCLFGRTPQEAVEAVVKARDAWIATARDEGREIPVPRYKPAAVKP